MGVISLVDVPDEYGSESYTPHISNVRIDLLHRHK